MKLISMGGKNFHLSMSSKRVSLVYHSHSNKNEYYELHDNCHEHNIYNFHLECCLVFLYDIHDSSRFVIQDTLIWYDSMEEIFSKSRMWSLGYNLAMVNKYMTSFNM
jgi:hypothetical protein